MDDQRKEVKYTLVAGEENNSQVEDGAKTMAVEMEKIDNHLAEKAAPPSDTSGGSRRFLYIAACAG